MAERKSKSKKIVYSEPKDYFPKEVREILKEKKKPANKKKK